MVGVKLYAHIFQCFLFSRRSISPWRRILSLRTAHYVLTSNHYPLASTRKQKRDNLIFKSLIANKCLYYRLRAALIYFIACFYQLSSKSKLLLPYISKVKYTRYTTDSIIWNEMLEFLFVLELVSRPKILKWMSKTTQGWMNNSECHRGNFHSTW